MFWLGRTPWAKWIAVGLLTAVALWLEVRPDSLVEHPFANVDIAVGETIGPHNTEMRPVPAGMLEPTEEGAVALHPIPAGTPVLAAHIGQAEAVVPTGWWIVSLDVPAGAAIGDQVRVVLLDESRAVPGVVSSVSSSDGFVGSSGGVAVEPGEATGVAVAAAEGRVVVLLSVG